MHRIDDKSLINEKTIFGQNTNKGNEVLDWSKKDNQIRLFFTSPCHGGVESSRFISRQCEVQCGEYLADALECDDPERCDGTKRFKREL